jgi:hypothetical protein
MPRRRKKLHGTVEKVIKPNHPKEPEKAQIGIEGADDLYREIRIENVLTDEAGEQGKLKTGEEVNVIVETKTDPQSGGPAAKKAETS